MKVTRWAVAMVGVAVLSTPAVAVNPPSQATLNRRQMVSCMTHRMTVSKTISYNDAAKLCKDQIKSTNAGVNASNVPRVADAR